MPLHDPDTLFCKAVCSLMLKYDYRIRPSAKAYANTVLDCEWFRSGVWREVIEDVHLALKKHGKNEPLRFLQFVSDITNFITPEGVSSYRACMRVLFQGREDLALWRTVDISGDSIYAFAMYVLAVDHSVHKKELAEITTSILNVPFKFVGDSDRANSDFLLALFGPVWHSLYYKDALYTADLIELIWLQRPPIIRRGEISHRPPVLPAHIEMN